MTFSKLWLTLILATPLGVGCGGKSDDTGHDDHDHDHDADADADADADDAMPMPMPWYRVRIPTASSRASLRSLPLARLSATHS